MKILQQGNKAFLRNYKLYKKLIEQLDFPKISEKAIDIYYIYRYDGYLPKFIFNLCYKLPKSSKVKVFEKHDNGIIKIQTYLEDDFFKTVKYTEFQE